MLEGIPVINRLLWKLRPVKTVDLKWYLELKRKNFGSSRVKVGFGHVHTDETTLTNRKWHIDPIVDGINRYSDRYVADIFFPYDSLSRFDLIVILKHIEFTSESELAKLRKKGKKILFNISDNPSSCKFNYETTGWFLDNVDALLLLNPLQSENLPQYASKFYRVSPPIIDDSHKTRYLDSPKVRIFWDGFADNLYTLEKLISIVKKVAESCSKEVELIINSNVPGGKDGIVTYRTWNIETWKSRMLECDIGAIIKPVNDVLQQRKPATKLITYLGAGLPVICTPSAADREVIEHGQTGFCAYTDEDWVSFLKLLIDDASLRERVGRAARKSAVSRYSIENVTRQYTAIFDELLDQATKP